MKTHLLTKKRALISSVAMLLVAIIALGTATFAWFTQSTTATARGINVRTIKASELQISDVKKNWGTNVNYQVGYDDKLNKGTSRVLMPVSSADGTSWFKANASDRKSYKSDGPASLVESREIPQYYFADQLNVRNNGDAAVDNVQISFELHNDSTKRGYYRIALVPVNTNDEVTTLAPVSADDFFANKKVGDDTINTLTNIYGQTDTNGYQALTGTDVTKNLSARVMPNKATTVDVGRLEGKTDGKPVAKYYNLYVWFEGQDEDCTDEKAGAEIPDITFTVTGDTVQD